MDSGSTLETKRAFERISKVYGVQIKDYHYDNDIFDTTNFRFSIHCANQTMTFYRVKAHHQNGKAERRIKKLTSYSRTSLLHVNHR